MSKPNFRIVEGNDNDVDFEKFKELFFDDKKMVKDVCDELDISTKKYNRLRRELIKEVGFIRKPVDKDYQLKDDPMRYISSSKKGYSVNKQIDHRKMYFGIYQDLETAQYVRDAMEALDWDEDAFYSVRKKVRPRKQPYSDDEYEKVKRDYMAGYTIREIIRRNNITNYKYSCISKRVRTEENLFTKPRMKR